MEYFKLAANQGNRAAQLAFSICALGGDQMYLEGVESYLTKLSQRGDSNDQEWKRFRRLKKPREMHPVETFSAVSAKADAKLMAAATDIIKRNSKMRQYAGAGNEKASCGIVDVDSLREISDLGLGGFAVVKLMANSLDEKFAVKFPLTTSNQQIRESEAFLKLHHPCICPVYKSVSSKKRHIGHVVMKYMENRSLDCVLDSVREGNPPQFWNGTGIAIIVCGIVVGLSFIHSQVFVHRDLKPGNLLIDKRGRCYIGDFGSSKYIEDARRWTIGIPRSPHYSAPELDDPDRCSEKVDVFSFGLILYEILAGEPYFDPEISELNVMLKVANGLHVEPRGRIDRKAAALIDRCLATDPTSRPSFDDILDELWRMNLQILPGVDFSRVESFLEEVSVTSALRGT